MSKQSAFKKITIWNRKWHIHLGLFLLLFIWLFSLSGLLLNHSNWKFASFWDQRKEIKTTSAIVIAPDFDSAAAIRYITQYLHINGEVSEVNFNKDSIDFRSSVPGHIRNIHVDLKRGICTQKETRFNLWGIIRTFHTFNGVKDNPSAATPNWIMTYIWRYTMDGIAIALMALCISSYIMWYKLNKRRVSGFILLAAGFAGAIYFIFLIRS
ncbi:MAG: hypothetical protein NVSMB7_06920 [Chitinophagaceae bacterium]